VPPVPSAAGINHVLLSFSQIVADFTDDVLARIKEEGTCAVDIESVRNAVNGPLRAAIQTFETNAEQAHQAVHDQEGQEDDQNSE
jgi:hypothetical protein